VLDGLRIQWMHDPTVDIAGTFTRMLVAPPGAEAEAKPAE